MSVENAGMEMLEYVQRLERKAALLDEAIQALSRSLEALRSWNGMDVHGPGEAALWEAYRHSPEVSAIVAVLKKAEALKTSDTQTGEPK